MSSTRFFCLTVNLVNASEADIDFDRIGDLFPQHPRERYASWQLELGEESGNMHVQAYVELDRAMRPSTFVALFVNAGWPHPHVEMMRGTRDAARDYTRKEDTRIDGPWERGVWVPGPSLQGKRNDLEDACHTLRVTKSLKAVAEAHPATFVRCHKGLQVLQDVLDLHDRPSDAEFAPRPWQARVLSKVSQPANDRNIIWVLDADGNSGKSRLARHLVLEHNAIILEGRVLDMAYLYNKEPIVCIDITRAQAEYSKHLFSFAEKLKNGMVTSTKFECRTKLFKPPHVVFFSNAEPPSDVWTTDRLVLVDLAEPHWHSPHFLPSNTPASSAVPPEDPFLAGYA